MYEYIMREAIEKERQLRKSRELKKIRKIALTGGPNGGKSTSLKLLKKHYDSLGYHTVIWKETATTLFEAGVPNFPSGTLENKQLQKTLLKQQIQAERDLENLYSHYPHKKVLLFFDRGALDQKIYCSPQHWNEIVEELGYDEKDLAYYYDLVFYLETAALGTTPSYTTATNPHRRETAEEAIEANKRGIDAWSVRHDMVYLHCCDGGYTTKINSLLRVVDTELGL